MTLQPTILLTFDVEEFDLPLEYNLTISPQEQMMPGKKGMDEIEALLKSHGITSTMFTTARYAIEYSNAIKQLSQQHEIASHTYDHSNFEKTDLLKSKKVLEEITGKTIGGLRMPRMKPVPMEWVSEAGYRYDSSVNPTWIPGRYNNRHLPRTFYTENGVLRLPASVTPILRIPLFWLSFKNFPYPLFKNLCLKALKKDGYLSLYFHNWEFSDLTHFPLPKYLIKNSGRVLADRLDKLVTDLKKEAAFDTVSNYISKYGLK